MRQWLFRVTDEEHGKGSVLYLPIAPHRFPPNMASYSDISGSSEAAVVSKNRFNRTSLPGNDDVGIDRTEYRDDSRIQTSRDC
jgi:hypothetical protein